MKRHITIAIFIFISLFFTAAVSADIVYLKNGRSVEGIIQKEDADNVVLFIGFGTVTFPRPQVQAIKRSGAKDTYNLAKSWEAKKKYLEEKEAEFEAERQRRYEEALKNWADEAKKKKSSESLDKKHIRIARDQATRSIFVEVVLNDKVIADLVLDTGASLVILSRNKGEEMGLDLADTKDVMELRLADGRRTLAKPVILDSMRIQDVEVKKVMAAVMLDQIPGPGLRDGLLGMSFLSKFNLSMDLKNMRMSLEKLE